MLVNSAIEMMAFVNAMPWANMVLDEDSTVLSVSHSILELSGWTPEEIIGRPIHIIIPADTPHPHFVSLSVYSAGDGIQKPLKPLSDVPLLRKDGIIVRVSVERYIYSFDGRTRFGGVVRKLETQET